MEEANQGTRASSGGQGGLSEDRTMGQEWRRLHKAVRRRDAWRGRSSALFTKGKLVRLEHQGGGECTMER